MEKLKGIKIMVVAESPKFLVGVRIAHPLHTYHFKKFSSRCRYGKPLATVNGSNSAGNKAIETPHGESVPIGRSASYMGP